MDGTNEVGQPTIMIALSLAIPLNRGTQLTGHGLNYDMVVDRVKVLANGTEISPTARIQCYAGAIVFADLHALSASIGDGQRLAVPGQITMTDLIRVRGDLPPGATVQLSGIGAAERGPQHEDWSGSSPTRPPLADTSGLVK